MAIWGDRMSALVIPEELVSEMYFVRENTGISIRKQIIQAIEDYLDKQDDEKRSLILRQIDAKTSRVFNTRTGRFHNLELGVDVVS